MTFGEYLKQSRESVGLTQKNVANELGYTTVQLQSNNERDLSFPPIKKIKKLSKILRIDETSLKEHLHKHMVERYSENVKRKLGLK